MRCSSPSITDLEKSYVYDAMSKNDIGVGEYVKKFEQAWADYNGKQYGVACTSGTVSLYLALKALGIGPGDEVLVPEFTMVATAWAVTYTGAKPVFVDCDEYLTMRPDFKVTKKTKAIMPTPIYGRSVAQEVYDNARYKGLKIVEDMAEGHGIAPRGDISCYSFYGNKILTTGEGGMCLTDDKALAEEMFLLSNMYFDKERTMLHPKVGHNFRMTNIQAAIGLAQVERADQILEKREKIEFWYDHYIPKEMKMPRRDVLWMYDIDCGENQVEIKEGMEKAGIETRWFFKPMSQQPPYYNKNYKSLNAYKWSQRGIYLPTFTSMTRKDVQDVCKILHSVKP